MSTGDEDNAGACARTADDRAAEVNASLAMTVFLAGWSMLFAGLFLAYGLLRLHHGTWPEASVPRWPIRPMVASALPLLLAVGALSRAARRHDRTPQHLPARAAYAETMATALSGAAFIALQCASARWAASHGLTPSASNYGASVWAMTVVHSGHVLLGSLGVAWSAIHATFSRGASRESTARRWLSYWRFLLGVWCAITLLVQAW